LKAEVVGTGTFATQDSEKVADNDPFTDGTTPLQPVGFVFDDAAGTSLTENDLAAARIDSKRAQVLVLEDATTRGQGAAVSAGGALTVDGSAVTQPISAASLPLPASAATSANQLADNHQVTVSNSTLEVVGDVAHGTAVGGNPLLLGVEGRTTLPTAVGDGEVVRLQADDQGRLITSPYAPRDLVVQNRIILTGTGETTLLALDASNFHDLVLLTMSNSSSTGVLVDIRDSTGGTIRESVFLAADGGGAAIPYPATLPQAATNQNWTAQLGGAVSSVYITVVAVKRA
jgi:hypothetical protein